MLDVLKSMSGGPWNWLIGWLFPSLVACSAAAFFVLPRHGNIPIPKEGGQQTALLIGSALALALLLGAVSAFLYRVLEGYVLLPQCVKSAWTRRRVSRRLAAQAIQDAMVVRLTATPTPGDHLELALAAEALSRHPASDSQIGPTRFGNAIRAFETYGSDRYALDVPLFWSELTGLVPPALREEEASARSAVDFLVCLIWLGPCYAVLGVMSLITAGWDWVLFVTVLVGLGEAPLLYRAAITTCDRWANSVRAIVNVGRHPLADSLGLRVPPDLADERAMWERLGWFAGNDFREADVSDLDKYRKGPPGASE